MTISPEDLKDKKKVQEKLKKDLRSSHFSFGSQKNQFNWLKVPSPNERNSTASVTMRNNFMVGFSKTPTFLPKHGVMLGSSKENMKTSNQMFYKWIQPKPTKIK